MEGIYLFVLVITWGVFLLQIYWGKTGRRLVILLGAELVALITLFCVLAMTVSYAAFIDRVILITVLTIFGANVLTALALHFVIRPARCHH